MASYNRKDSKGRVLYTGEYERSDGKYSYSVMKDGKRTSIYAMSLESLREKEAQIQKDELNDVDPYLAGTATVNFLFERYMGVKRDLRAKTKEGYLYIYNHYVREVFGKKIIREVKYSDVVYLYEYYLKERQLEYNTLKSINRVLYPTFDLAERIG